MGRVLITGCNSGFGLGAARLLAEKGDTVYATVRDPEAASELRKVRDSGLPITIVKLDVRDASGAAAVVDQVLREGGIDALVNNAGVSMFAAIEEVSIEQSRAMLETNYLGPLRLIQLVLPHMRKRRAGRIVNVSSIAGYVPAAFMSTYDATKHALDALSFCLAAELHDFGIRVSIVSPGGFNTAVGGKLWAPDINTDEPSYRQISEAYVASWFQYVADRDPIEVSQAIVDAVHADDPPMRRFVGDDSVAMAELRRHMSDDDWVKQMLSSRVDS